MAQIMINGTAYTVSEAGVEGFPRVTTEHGRAYLLMPSHRNPDDPNESYLIPEARNGRPFGPVLTWDGEDITTIRPAETAFTSFGPIDRDELSLTGEYVDQLRNLSSRMKLITQGAQMMWGRERQQELDDHGQ